MKFAMNSLVAAVALATLGYANAATVVAETGKAVVVTDNARGAASTNRSAEITITEAGGALFFSNGQADPTVLPATRPNSVGGLVGALNVGKVVVTPVDGAKVDERIIPVGNLNRQTRAFVSIGADVTSLTADTATGAFSIVNTRGGATQNALYIENVLDGGTITVKNLKVDLIAKTVSADLSGRALLTGPDTPAVYGDEINWSGVLWNIGNISGPTALPPAELIAAADGNIGQLTTRGYELIGQKQITLATGQTVTDYTVKASNTLSKLTVTDEGFAVFAQALGLVEGSTGYTTLNGVNNGATGWGTLKSSITFTAHEVFPVPEPSTYALMGLGLVGISLVARRRAAK